MRKIFDDNTWRGGNKRVDFDITWSDLNAEEREEYDALDHPTFTMKEALKYNSTFVDEIDSPSPSISDEDYPETEENTSSNTSSNSRLYNLLRQYAQVIPEEGEITLSDDEMSFSDNTN